MQSVQQEMEDLDRQIEEELERVKNRLDELQNARRISHQAFTDAWKELEEMLGAEGK